MKEKLIKYGKRALRVGAAAFVGALVGDFAKEPVVGVVVAAAYGMIGKMLRDKWPTAFGWLPIL